MGRRTWDVQRDHVELLAGVSRLLAQGSRRIKANYDSLTPREREVIELVAQELTNREISDRLRISERTVHTYRSVGMDKLEVKTVLQLANALEMIKN